MCWSSKWWPIGLHQIQSDPVLSDCVKDFWEFLCFDSSEKKKGRYVAPTDENVSRRFTYSGRVDDLHFGEVEVSASI